MDFKFEVFLKEDYFILNVDLKSGLYLFILCQKYLNKISSLYWEQTFSSL